jgi:hypothetical protein
MADALLKHALRYKWDRGHDSHPLGYSLQSFLNRAAQMFPDATEAQRENAAHHADNEWPVYKRPADWYRDYRTEY